MTPAGMIKSVVSLRLNGAACQSRSFDAAINVHIQCEEVVGLPSGKRLAVEDRQHIDHAGWLNGASAEFASERTNSRPRLRSESAKKPSSANER
jgi:hypothetical protein